MIIDKLENASRYFSISPNLTAALTYLQEHKDSLGEVPLKQVPLNEDVKMKRIVYNTVVGSRTWESHLEFTDLQYMVRGDERIGFNHTEFMVNAKKQPDKDQICYDGDGDRVFLPEGYFIVLFPGEVHMSKLADGQAAEVEKVSFKIRL